MLNNPPTISHTNDEEMKHACNSNNDSYLSDECQSINVTIKNYNLFNVLDILSEFDVDRLQINVTIRYLLHFGYCGHLPCPFLYDNGSLIHIYY